MPFLPDVQLAALPGDNTEEKFESLVRQLNEWGRTISNETRTDVYNDNSGTPKILIGVLPDGETAIVMSKDGIDVNTAFV